MMNTFQIATEKTRKIKCPSTKALQTQEFLDVCRQVLPVVGEFVVCFLLAIFLKYFFKFDM